MNRITHKYYISLQLLDKIEKYLETYNPTYDEFRSEIRKLRLQYRCGLSKVER